MGFDVPANVPAISYDADDRVIVPRFAAAVGMARGVDLVPLCVPLTGVRNPEDNSYTTDTLEPAPDGLEVNFLTEPLDAQEMSPTPKYHRLVGGKFTIKVDGGPDLPAVAEIETPDAAAAAGDCWAA